MRKLLAALAIALSAAVGVAGPAFAQPGVGPSGAVTLPDGPAQAWLLADLDSGRILASRNPYEPHPPASTIKALLAMVVLDHLPLNAVIRASQAAADVECSCAGVKAGRAYTVRQLLDGLMLVSGNDAANTLADGLGGYRVAVARMNAKAAALGARTTRASSPSGLDGPGMESVTTANDLAVIYRAALRYPVFAAIVRQPSSLFPTDNGPKTIVNQNELLKRYPGTLVGKTGYTNLARKTYVGAAERNGRRLVVAQLYGSGDLYGQAIKLLDWGFTQPR
ncbi:D-alanyl-D-alanine carboxypeptidase family protein [Mycolicibacterium elephantis]|uniref:D-alanyl-D-alanine carboxypeptidase n=1 Tax=Mycolicibacterium elephantis DSM 44368 TaxID=1335622 RepID=A0A439DY82_9MYCO|nr:D-alanyl-D-alanine carboxypeptidase family protein [Mycolicibacterium elephantis]MCV7223096.1 D-alanyl-D-alanine carboxypeptidase [Mycolicibacterium elephantis]RWA22502.1 D-alanyl-D-alanine carboxypeptidase [Mycolicibacterium elephantis DSM 44368]